LAADCRAMPVQPVEKPTFAQTPVQVFFGYGAGNAKYDSMIQAHLTGTITCRVLLSPLDVIKNVMQGSFELRENRPQHSMRDAVKHIRTEGWSGFFRGLTPGLLFHGLGQVTFLYQNEKFRAKPWATPLTAAMAAKWVTVSVYFPLEMLSTRAQAMQIAPWPLMKQIIWDDKFLSLWRGYGITCMKEVPHAGIFWSSYIAVRDAVFPDEGSNEQQAAFIVANTIGCATLASVLTHPMDVVKTRQQASGRFGLNQRGFLITIVERVDEAVKNIHKTHGWQGFTVGIVPRVLRIWPASILLMGTYELADYCMRPIQHIQLQKHVNMLKKLDYARVQKEIRQQEQEEARKSGA